MAKKMVMGIKVYQEMWKEAKIFATRAFLHVRISNLKSTFIPKAVHISLIRNLAY